MKTINVENENSTREWVELKIKACKQCLHALKSQHQNGVWDFKIKSLWYPGEEGYFGDYADMCSFCGTYQQTITTIGTKNVPIVGKKEEPNKIWFFLGEYESAYLSALIKREFTLESLYDIADELKELEDIMSSNSE